MRVVDAMVSWMEAANVDHYFGYAGGAIWPLMDALIEAPQIEGIQAKHESHAVHMADIYYRVTGRIAPVFVTKGPGLMNTAGAIATAMHDPAAVLLIAGAGSTHLYGKGGMQEMYYKGHEDAVNVFRPITKGSWLIQRPDTAIDIINHAYKVALSGRPGPVFVQIPFDIQLAEVFGHAESPSTRISSSHRRADRDSVERAAALLLAAERPVLMAGGGCQRSPGSAAALGRLLELLPMPFVTTLTAKGMVPESHRLSLGPVGRSGTDAAAQATRNADVLVAVGARFSDNNTSNWRNGLVYSVPQTKIIQVNIEDEEIGRNYPVELGIVADAEAFLSDLADEIERRAPPMASQRGTTGPKSGRHSGRRRSSRSSPARLIRSIPDASPTRLAKLSSVTMVGSFATLVTWCSTPSPTWRSTTPTPGTSPRAWQKWAGPPRASSVLSRPIRRGRPSL